MHIGNQLSVEQARALIPNKASLFDALVRNGYLMPPKSSIMLSMKFMFEVKEKRCWILHTSEVTGVIGCASPPNRQQLSYMLNEVMLNLHSVGEPRDSAIRATAEVIKKNPPAVSWMLLVLASLQPDHQVFQKNYQRPLKPKV